MARIEQDLKQLFRNNANHRNVIPLMTERTFIKVVSNLLTEYTANNTNSKLDNYNYETQYKKDEVVAALIRKLGEAETEIKKLRAKINVSQKRKIKNEKNSKMTYDVVLYAVLKLLTLVEVKDIAGNKHKVEISGAEGYIPVFATKEEAELEYCNGKYQIFAMRVPK